MKGNFLKKTILASLLLAMLPLANAASVTDVEKYNNAKIAVKYKGAVGDFAQQIAYKLGIGFYAYQSDPTTNIRIEQDDNASLSVLLANINGQLEQENLRFEILNDRVVLALTGNQVKELTEKQYIGSVIFDNSIVDAVEKPAEESSQNSIEIIPPEQQIDAGTSDVGEIAATIQPQDEKAKLDQAKKIQDILSVSQDQKLIAQYGRRKQPVYNIENKSAVKLDTVKSTKVSTFLVFENGVNVDEYQIEGKFQDIAKLDNIVAILHRQQQPPATITLVAPNGERQVLRNTQ
ncbi:hypothetical protein FHQ26_03570 [Testudinibacter sp. TR-2022]|uniref:hypothetical protein n=1 Tax=Testudinibacter sp. TR-2022 TaxID=2585029 RepID=UPI001119AD77|nr:hypothetical protein [Testudinibacter sp. TR-2022]TNH00691.1 hypothetical protein FHQ22_11900 [Pasteurellaceae bacterium Phil31]TNH07009.1 hypothetical protein FHQ25_11850 [Testudinibacter sp. TR-2022]TNH10496.1 hypothetical protein FIA56_12120 [Testudinibacter sp. TR-2022]TNH11288.1 hypothetical protein FHQ26_03570 [Testudinibacter sp. TR-2022]TNH16528.1 hypothetical protein FHQ23_08360 [Testudinibacter sp. TR-2022]